MAPDSLISGSEEEAAAACANKCFNQTIGTVARLRPPQGLQDGQPKENRGAGADTKMR